jgi:ABC-type branched-subunit amino acid transport system substrate-binding protein
MKLFVPSYFDAAWTMATAATALLRRGIDPLRNGSALLQEIKANNFDGTSGPVSFDANGDRVGAYSGLFNFLPWKGELEG